MLLKKTIFLIKCTFINTPLNLSDQLRKLAKQNCFKKNEPVHHNIYSFHVGKLNITLKKYILFDNNNNNNNRHLLLN